MRTLGLSTPVWAFLGAGLLFLLLMLLWWSVGLLKETKALLRTAGDAARRISTAMEDVSQQTRAAADRASHISEPRKEPDRVRRTP